MESLKNYPLPVCEELNAPYWLINLQLCGISKDYRHFQSEKSMDTLISIIRWLFNL